MDVDPTQHITLPEKDAAKRLLVSDEEAAALLRAAENQLDDRKAAFSKALISALIYTGMRAQECVQLKLEHVNMDAQMLLVDNGKGKKSRQLYPPYEFFVALQGWLTVRAKMECTHTYVWAQDTRRPISADWLRRHVYEIAAMAGMKGAPNIKPHSLRHWFATHMTRNGANIKQVQVALGHSHAQTTFLYIHGDEEDAKAMAQLASFNPYAFSAPQAASQQQITQNSTPAAPIRSPIAATGNPQVRIHTRLPLHDNRERASRPLRNR